MRKVKRLAGVSGGLPTDEYGFVHTTFLNKPSTWRLSSAAPNLQNIPRAEEHDEWQSLVRGMFKARPDPRLLTVAPNEPWTFVKRDFSAVEAIISGYLMPSRRFTRIAKLGPHSFFAARMLGKPADAEWDDTTLGDYLGEIKREAQATIMDGVPLYDLSKRVGYLTLYMGTPKRMHDEYPKTFKDVRVAAYYQDMYYELFPELQRWHEATCQQVGGKRGTTFFRAPFGYVHRYYRVIEWKKQEGGDGKDAWKWKYGEDAKRLIAFGPQNTAGGILKEGTLGFWERYVQFRDFLRVLIHDELFGMCPRRQAEEVLAAMKDVMERPIECLPLDPSWGMGEYLQIASEGSIGGVWSEMKKVKD